MRGGRRRQGTRGKGCGSERVNGLLRFALEQERRAALSKEAAGFFAGRCNDRAERRAFEAASLAAWKRD